MENKKDKEILDIVNSASAYYEIAHKLYREAINEAQAREQRKLEIEERLASAIEKLLVFLENDWRDKNNG